MLKRAFSCIEEGVSLFYSCFLLCFQLNFLCFIGWLSLFYRDVFLVLQLGFLCFVESAFMYLLESLQLLFFSYFHVLIIVSFPLPDTISLSSSLLLSFLQSSLFYLINTNMYLFFCLSVLKHIYIYILKTHSFYMYLRVCSFL